MGDGHELTDRSRALGPWIALAGLLVGAGLAVGLYFGLRREPTPVTPSSPLPPLSIDASILDDAVIERATRAALEPLRAAWRAACWGPAIARAPSPATSVHVVNLGFDAAGRELMRSINDVRDRTRGDVATCLREQPHVPLTIPAPGRNIQLELELAFP